MRFSPRPRPHPRPSARPVARRGARTLVLAPAAALVVTSLLAPTEAAALAEAAIAPVAAPLSSPSSSPQVGPKRLPPLRVVPGKRLKAKPPAYLLPVAGYHLTGRFGASSSLWSSTHTGLDFAAAEGSPIHAVAGGVVVSTGYDGSYGNKTVVRLADGTVLWYAHQSGFAVSVGQQVAPGELIGYVGSTGNVTGPHLHLEVRPGDGDPIDPDAWLTAHGLRP